jgi:hypothetical protein
LSDFFENHNLNLVVHMGKSQTLTPVDVIEVTDSDDEEPGNKLSRSIARSLDRSITPSLDRSIACARTAAHQPLAYSL